MAGLSDRIGLSLSACHRRVKALEAAGIVRGYAAQLDRKSLGLEIQVFIEVKVMTQRPEDLKAFEEAIQDMPEILECHMISGEFSYLMRVAAASTADYEDLYRNRLSMIPSVSQIVTLLCLSTVKEFRGFHIA